MKKTINSITSVVLALVMIFSFASCAENADSTGVWENAVYLKDTEFGKGTKAVQVEIIAEEQSVTFTIHTDKETLGDALFEHDLIAGENGAYGLYVKTVNGILADYDIDQTYWALSKNSEASMTGVDGTKIADGEHYELVYTKG